MPNRRIRVVRDIVLPRVVEKRDYWLCVIAIEGEKTEKQYFQKFGGAKVKVDILPTYRGDSAEPEGIITRLRKYKRDNDLQERDKCWLVCDVDHRDDTILNTVCYQASEEHFQVAISNPCFEFWLFLHKFDASELRHSIYQVSHHERPHEMKQILHSSPYNYQSLSYKDFRADVDRAIRRAMSKEKGRRTHFPKFPGTDVYKLVDSLPVKAAED